ncbi:Deoxyadenosine/deoxycytidine kinase (plasmid) [Bacillus subtilis]|uniref:Uncharacterized protein n=3 Tax=Bacillus subtilis TaxID=1423 RepID=S5DW61_BACIU|nr:MULTISPECIES: hypothetical protein [Bacillus]MBU8845721.1 hypothetical protein [Alkalicoccobacillus gibsonii]AGQ21309.1 unknown [Bacillus subtilis subsp. subtilis NCIB 3610 = ATCC 6051 = DSM 10]AJO60857.1 hypothetical protein QF06_20585 [Bacillus sp. YP1]AQZ93217.1 hypothetical protein B4U62_22455 [Bacillus subtilis]KAA0930075.1 hypothetical protein FQ086_21235 [Bacillus sp. ANT_WA51]
MTNSTTCVVAPTPEFVKPKIIILEGVDRSGKSTLQHAINKATCYKHIVVDRGPIGFKTYCDLFSRDPQLWDNYDDLEKHLAKMEDVLVIYLDCDTKVLIDRCIQTGHEILDYTLHKHFYKFYFDKSPMKKIIVDTTYKTPEEIANDLVKEGVL